MWEKTRNKTPPEPKVQLPMVTEALLLNGPGAGKRASVLSGETIYLYMRPGEPSAEYMIRRWGVDKGTRKTDSVKIYRVGYVDKMPTDDEVQALIDEAAFQHYFDWFPQKR